MTKLSSKLKKSYFGPFLGNFFFYSKNLVVTHNTTWASDIMLSFKKKLCQSQENFWTEGQEEGRIDRPSVMSPFWHGQGSKKLKHPHTKLKAYKETWTCFMVQYLDIILTTSLFRYEFHKIQTCLVLATPFFFGTNFWQHSKGCF